MYRKNILLFLFNLIIIHGLFAAFVSKNDAELVARHFYWERISARTQIDLQDIKIKSVLVDLKYGKAVIYHVNFQNGGFVSIAADDAAYPVIAYDFTNQISNENLAPNYEEWMTQRAKEIAYIRKKHLPASAKISREWKRLRNLSMLQVFSGKSVDPLIPAKWNQDALYNALAPTDQFGPGGHAYAGCVAVAMAQIMYYYRYPKHGIGSHSYLSNYGQLSANFASATYDYNSMTNSMPMGGNMEIAKLLYHCAVAVEMDFSASGSGAWPALSVTSLKQNFGYQNSLSLKYKSGYSYNQWVNMIVNDIDNKIPLFYAGYSPSGGGGHAFNLDGYQGSDFFHFNWGWGGAFNGYYYLNAMNPGSSSFVASQQAIFDIYPKPNAFPGGYPYGCSPSLQTLTSTEGTLYDGSGPGDYQPNNNCRWLIQPAAGIDHMIITFDKLQIAPGDTLTLYDGNSANAPVLAQAYSGLNLNSVISTGKSVFISFKTDASLNDDGFGLSYRSVMPVFCQGTMNLTAPSDTFSDGSGPGNYNNGTLCRWYIKPASGDPVRLYFTSFDTEQGKDIIKIYNPATTPSKLLATYSGAQIPPSVYSPGGEMMLIFSSNQSNPKAGWEAYYISGPSVGIEENNDYTDFRIYPNPAKQLLNIRFTREINVKELDIYSSQGQLIKSFDYNTTIRQIELPVDDLPPGYYILKIKGRDKIMSKAFIIQR